MAAPLEADSQDIAHTVAATGRPAKTVRRTTATRYRQCTDRVYSGWEAELDSAHLGRPHCSSAPLGRSAQSLAFLSRSALPMTETELKVIAALASIGLSSSPKNG